MAAPARLARLAGRRPSSGGIARESLRYFIYVVRSSPLSIVGVSIVASVLLLTLISPWIVPYDPENASTGETLQAPSGKHLLGTDSSGLDILSRLLTATRTDIPVAILATLGAMVIGVGLGVVAGYFGNRRGLKGMPGEILLRVMDVLQAFPVFILAMALVASTGPSPLNVGIAVTFVNAPIFLRLIRQQVLGLREMSYVEAARCAGAKPLRIAFVNILPGVVSPALIQGSVTVGFAILLTAGLSFVGAGVPAPTPEWGLMIANGSHDIQTGQWWTSVFPGLALAVTVLGFALTGEAVGRALDPLQRR